MANMTESPAGTTMLSKHPAGSEKNGILLKCAWLVLPLGYLWYNLIDNLHLEWETNPQYSYGLVVPLLAMGLLLRRWQNTPGDRRCQIADNPWSVILFCGALAFVYLPTRLIEAATPEWRPLQWALGFETVGLTLYAVYIAGGKTWLRLAAFPVAFILVAIPWPTLFEAPIIQGLSRANAAMVVEVMDILGVPAMQHGNTIEVSTGVVGINDACSGIRSFQSSLMISLFLGEYYLFSWRRRLLLVPIGIVLAMALNLCRTSLLTWLAAKKGISAIAEYHDEAGLTILLACTALLWVAGWLMNRWKTPPGSEEKVAPVDLEPVNAVARDTIDRRVKLLGISLIVWLVVVESGVALWYRIRESGLKPGPMWSVKFPRDNPSFTELPLTKEEHELLRFDQGQQGAWRESDGTQWQAFYYNWVPGRVAGYLAKRHTPDICLTATGCKMISGPDLMVLNVNSVELPMRHYVFDSASGLLQVYQCHWEAGMGKGTYTADESARFNLILGVWAGRGNQGQKVLEVIVSGSENAESARQALIHQLDNLIQVEK
jgi:exosortase